MRKGTGNRQFIETILFFFQHSLTSKRYTVVKNIEFKRLASRRRFEPTTLKFAPQMVGQVVFGFIKLIEKVYFVNVLTRVDPIKLGETGGKLASAGEFANIC